MIAKPLNHFAKEIRNQCNDYISYYGAYGFGYGAFQRSLEHLSTTLGGFKTFILKISMVYGFYGL